MRAIEPNLLFTLPSTSLTLRLMDDSGAISEVPITAGFASRIKSHADAVLDPTRDRKPLLLGALIGLQCVRWGTDGITGEIVIDPARHAAYIQQAARLVGQPSKGDMAGAAAHRNRLLAALEGRTIPKGGRPAKHTSRAAGLEANRKARERAGLKSLSVEVPKDDRALMKRIAAYLRAAHAMGVENDKKIKRLREMFQY